MDYVQAAALMNQRRRGSVPIGELVVARALDAVDPGGLLVDERGMLRRDDGRRVSGDPMREVADVAAVPGVMMRPPFASGAAAGARFIRGGFPPWALRNFTVEDLVPFYGPTLPQLVAGLSRISLRMQTAGLLTNGEGNRWRFMLQAGLVVYPLASFKLTGVSREAAALLEPIQARGALQQWNAVAEELVLPVIQEYNRGNIARWREEQARAEQDTAFWDRVHVVTESIANAPGAVAEAAGSAIKATVGGLLKGLGPVVVGGGALVAGGIWLARRRRKAAS
jgi:hypothetical protein